MPRNAPKRDRGIVVDAVGRWRTDRLLVTERDALRLRATLARALEAGPAGSDGRRDAIELLAAALRSAVVVPPDRIPPAVVTMRSRVVLEDTEGGGRREVVLVYPEEEQLHAGRVSVLSPIGIALLGLAPGALVAWKLASGRKAILRVHSVVYQPEAAAEFHL